MCFELSVMFPMFPFWERESYLHFGQFVLSFVQWLIVFFLYLQIRCSRCKVCFEKRNNAGGILCNGTRSVFGVYNIRNGY